MIARPPAGFPGNAQSLYEGLAAMWFLREVCGSLGHRCIGRPSDRLLYGLYRRTRSGRLTLV